MAKKVTDAMLETALQLAAKGMGRSAIAEHLGVHVRTTYKGALGQSIKDGYKIARVDVIDNYIEMAKTNPQLLENLAKRLQLFQQPIPLTKPRTVQDIPGLLVDALEAWSNGLISSSQLVVVQNWTDKYIKAVEVADLIPRIEALEDAQHGD